MHIHNVLQVIILAYVDDIMAISHDPVRVMNQVQEEFDFKGNKCNDLDMYLGARISKKTIDGVDMWSMTSHDYLMH